MDLRSIESKGTPGLVAKISKEFTSFSQEWMDDRARSLATIYLLKFESPNLILLHFVDLDAAAHENGLPEFAIPRRVIYLDKVPLLGNGKKDYVKLQTMVREVAAKK